MQGQDEVRPGALPARDVDRASCAIDRAVVAAEAHLDAKFPLRTPATALPAEDVALGYKQLLEVERAWRDMKTTLDLRPVHHRKEARIRSHVLLVLEALPAAHPARRDGHRRDLPQRAPGARTTGSTSCASRDPATRGGPPAYRDDALPGCLAQGPSVAEPPRILGSTPGRPDRLTSLTDPLARILGGSMPIDTRASVGCGTRDQPDSCIREDLLSGRQQVFVGPDVGVSPRRQTCSYLDGPRRG